MPEVSFVGGEKRFITFKSADYDNATAVCFNFPGFRPGFQVPNDVTPQEMAMTLEIVANAIREGKTILYVPMRYHKERQEWIRKIQEEDHA